VKNIYRTRFEANVLVITMANDISRVNADQVTISNEIVSSNDIYNIIISEL